MRVWKSKQAEALYSEFPKRDKPTRAEATIVALLKSGEIDFETLMVRVKAFYRIWKPWLDNDEKMQFCPGMTPWLNAGSYDDDKVLAECSPKNRLKLMFEVWERKANNDWPNHGYPHDYHERKYVWLHLRKLDRDMPSDLHEEAGNQYNWSQRRYGSIFAGEAPTDIMAAVKELSDA